MELDFLIKEKNFTCEAVGKPSEGADKNEGVELAWEDVVNLSLAR